MTHKILLATAAAFLSLTFANAQSYLSSATFNKKSQPALILEVPYGEEVAEGAIESNLKKVGYDHETKGKLFWKKDRVDGYYLYKGVNLEGMGKPLDLYFKVDPKSRRDKNQSVIHLLMSNSGENFVSTAEAETYEKGKKFLDNFVSESANYKLVLDLKAQDEAVQNAEKKLTRLKDDEEDMKKKIDKLQNDLKKNQQDQENQVKLIEEEKRKQSELRAKQGSVQ